MISVAGERNFISFSQKSARAPGGANFIMTVETNVEAGRRSSLGPPPPPCRRTETVQQLLAKTLFGEMETETHDIALRDLEN